MFGPQQRPSNEPAILSPGSAFPKGAPGPPSNRFPLHILHGEDVVVKMSQIDVPQLVKQRLVLKGPWQRIVEKHIISPVRQGHYGSQHGGRKRKEGNILLIPGCGPVHRSASP